MPTNVSALKGSSTVILGVSPMHGETPSSLGSLIDFCELSLLLYLLQGAIVTWNPLANLNTEFENSEYWHRNFVVLNWKSPGKNFMWRKDPTTSMWSRCEALAFLPNDIFSNICLEWINSRIWLFSCMYFTLHLGDNGLKNTIPTNEGLVGKQGLLSVAFKCCIARPHCSSNFLACLHFSMSKFF